MILIVILMTLIVNIFYDDCAQGVLGEYHHHHHHPDCHPDPFDPDHYHDHHPNHYHNHHDCHSDDFDCPTDDCITMIVLRTSRSL